MEITFILIKNVFVSTIRSEQTFITKVYVNFYIKRFQKLLLLQNNISNVNRSSNGNNKKYTRTPAITLSTTRIWVIATSESEITTPSTTKTTTAIVTTMTTIFILKSITKTITRVVEMLSTLPMIWVTDHATNEIVIHPDLETLYLRSKYTQLLWANTPVQCVTRIPADINGTVIFNVKSSNRVSLLPSCQDGRLWKHDSRSDWSGYRSVRYRDWAGSKMFNKDECIFYINFGERNQKHFDNSLIVLALRNTLIVTHVSTPILSRTQNLIHTIMDNIHAKQRTTNDPGHHQWLTMFLRWIRLWHLHRCKPIVPFVSFPYRGISQSKEDSKWKNKVEKSSATKWWYRSRGYS